MSTNRRQSENMVDRRQKPDQHGEVRTTFVANHEYLEKLKAIAYWDRRSIKEVYHEVIESYINTYENLHGEVKPIPKR